MVAKADSVTWERIRPHYWRSRLGIVTAFPREGGLDPWYAYPYEPVIHRKPFQLGPFDTAAEAKSALEQAWGE